jgi:hypothetical protein
MHLTQGEKIAKEQYNTFSIQRGLEADNEFWIDMSVDIHIPNYIVFWVLNVIHSIIIFAITGTKLITARTKNLHVSHYDTAKNQMLNPIFVNITIRCTINMEKLNALKHSKRIVYNNMKNNNTITIRIRSVNLLTSLAAY